MSTNLNFKPIPRLTRTPIPVEELWLNSAMETSKEINELGLFNQMNYVGNVEPFNDVLNKPQEHSGRSGANVVDSNSNVERIPSKHPHIASYIPKTVLTVNKENNDSSLNTIEYTLANAFSMAGLPVPQISRNDLGSLSIPHLGSQTLENRIWHLGATPSYEIDLVNVYESIISSLAQFSKITTSTLTIDQKEFMEKFSTAKLAKYFEVSSEDVSENKYLLRLLKKTPGATSKDIEIYSPIAKILSDGEKNYGIWSVDIHPKNIMLLENDTAPNGQRLSYKITDFNRPKFGIPQEFDFLIIDAYTPIQEWMKYDVCQTQDENGNSVPVTNFLLESEKARSLKKSYHAHQQLGTFSSDYASYLQNIGPARFLVNKELASIALDELANAQKFQDIVKNTYAFIHHNSNMDYALNLMEKVNGIDKTPIQKHLRESLIDSFLQVRQPLEEELLYWQTHESTPEDRGSI